MNSALSALISIVKKTPRFGLRLINQTVKLFVMVILAIFLWVLGTIMVGFTYALFTEPAKVFGVEKKEKW